jgi:antitoxin (DNA-binding transcriptional repressor) of toxin-antitoxin stability system
MSTTIDIQELPVRLREIIADATWGAEIIVTEKDVPCAKLLSLPASSAVTKRTPGLNPGAIRTTPDFNAPLDEDFLLAPS